MKTHTLKDMTDPRDSFLPRTAACACTTDEAKAGSIRKNAALIVLCLLACGPGSAAFAQDSLDIETGIVFSDYNDVAVPGNTGTRFSLTDDLEPEQTAAFRVRYGRTVSGKHWVGILAAPLTVKSHGTPDRNIGFNGTTFQEGKRMDATFRFDSYRAIYRYNLHQSDTWQFSIGGALKVRDASITLESDGLEAEKHNTGLVPLLSFNITWTPVAGLHFLADGEALAAPQGRAEDVLFALQYDVNRRLALKTGYRLLEGGADNDEVYTFSFFHYIVAGAVWSF